MAQWDANWAERWMRSQAKRSDVYGAATERMLDLAISVLATVYLTWRLARESRPFWLLSELGRVATCWPQTFRPTC